MTTPRLALQPASLDIWEKKYQLRDKNGVPVDQNIHDTYVRVAKALASVELPEVREQVEKQFYYALSNGAIPAGRITSNVGAGEHKPNTSTINCTVSSTVRDSMVGILDSVHEAGRTLSAGCGIGYEFSTLRPKGAFVAGVGSTTSGPLSFMNIHDAMCFTVASAGGRRGAQMGTFDVNHPDVADFIKAKREDGRFRQFNLSLLITDDFIDAVKNDKIIDLSFPLNKKESWEGKVVWREWPVIEDYMITDEKGRVRCKIYSSVKAVDLWETIMRSTYEFSEPGFILVDKINEENNLWWCENIRATNPCGEQPLPPYGACLLGSINLCEFVMNPGQASAEFDFTIFEQVVGIFTRMLDNVVELANLPLPKQQEEIKRKRRHGMGFLGLGSACALLGFPYGSSKAVQFTEKVAKVMALTSWQVGVELAKEKGAAPIFKEMFEVTQKMIDRAKLLELDFQNGGKYLSRLIEAQENKEKVSGAFLFCMSNYMQRIFVKRRDLEAEIRNYGVRFSHATSIAPTGTISLSLANNASNGIEPSFSHVYQRNVIREGRNAKEAVDVWSYEALVWNALYPGIPYPESFATADDIEPSRHIAMQAAAQLWIDSSISKTINVPTNTTYEDFKEIYLNAHSSDLKGCTTFRFNPEVFQGVLVKKEDLANTRYEFSLADGSTFVATGDQLLEYEGQTHTAGNLFDALKEGYYGKF